ncbi:hypothetical protein MMC17_004376 [Xylographa soralifera]|nr:hypothetical protein [Xylographa soralifera]
MNGNQKGSTKSRHHRRNPTIPFEQTSRHKPRRWPLALRFIKGAIHGAIIVPVFLHALFAAVIVFIDIHLDGHLGLPPSIVFRNQASYNRFWEGRNHLTVMITSVRNLTRMILTCSFNGDKDESATRQSDRAETERAVKILMAILFATKNHLRAEWGAFPGVGFDTAAGNQFLHAEYSDLLPSGVMGYDHRGLGIPLQLTFFIEQYIKKGYQRGWYHAPQASQMTVQLNTLVDAYGRMETIRLTPVPIAHLIHEKQVLALFGMFLPFAMVTEMGWWAIPLTTFVVFTLYGIDGIAGQLEDPFGSNRNDINMAAIVEDIRSEILVLVDEWKRVGEQNDESQWFMGPYGGGSPLAGIPTFRVMSFDD